MVKESEDILLRFGTGLIERLFGIVTFAEETCNSQTSVDDVSNDMRVIELSADATSVVCHIDFAADVTVGAVLHNRDISGGLEVQHPAFEVALLGIGPQDGLGVIVQSEQVLFTGDLHGPCVGGLQGVLAVQSGQFGEVHCEFSILLFLLRREVGTVVGKAFIDILQEFALFGRQFEGVTAIVHRLDAGKELLVQQDRRRVLGQHGHELHLQFAQFVIGLGIGEVEEAALYDGEQFAGTLIRLNGIGKVGCSRIVDDIVNILQTLTDTFLKSGHIVLVANVVERIRAVRRFPRFILNKRIGSSQCGYRHSSKCHSGK